MIDQEHAGVGNIDAAALPPEVELILSAMDAGVSSTWDRRVGSRRPYRVAASLRLHADRADSPARTLYTRDVDARGAGFITRHLLPLGYGGWVTLTTADGHEVHAECVIYRCRKTVHGWYEGAMRFNRELWQFAGERPNHPFRGLRIAS